MSEQVFKYRDQIGSIEFDTDDDCLHGKLLHINDLVTYEADSMPELRKEFHAAVDDYLETCEELGQEPNKPFKGVFNVRVGEDLHRRAVLKATASGMALNELVTQAVKTFLDGADEKAVEHFHNHTHLHYGNLDSEPKAEVASPFQWSVKRNIPEIVRVERDESCH